MLCLPYGVIFVTVLYGCFAFFVLYQSDTICYEEDINDVPCRSEGVDNATINWASDFFIGLLMIVMSLHLLCCSPHRSTYCKRGFSPFLFLGLGFVFSGVGTKDFPNNGAGDGIASTGFFVAWGLSYFAWTESAVEFSNLCKMLAWRPLQAMEQPPRVFCGALVLNFFIYMVSFCFLGILGACVWCLTSTEILVDTAADEEPDDPYVEEPVCVQMIILGDMAWFGLYGFFWLAAASIFGTAAMVPQRFRDFAGLPNSLAAAGIIIVQVTLGTAYLALSGYYSVGDERESDYWYTVGALVFHYAMLMTAYFAHTLIFTLSMRPRIVQDEDKDHRGNAPQQPRSRKKRQEKRYDESDDSLSDAETGTMTTVSRSVSVKQAVVVEEVSRSPPSSHSGIQITRPYAKVHHAPTCDKSTGSAETQIMSNLSREEPADPEALVMEEENGATKEENVETEDEKVEIEEGNVENEEEKVEIKYTVIPLAAREASLEAQIKATGAYCCISNKKSKNKGPVSKNSEKNKIVTDKAATVATAAAIPASRRVKQQVVKGGNLDTRKHEDKIMPSVDDETTKSVQKTETLPLQNGNEKTKLHRDGLSSTSQRKKSTPVDLDEIFEEEERQNIQREPQTPDQTPMGGSEKHATQSTGSLAHQQGGRTLSRQVVQETIAEEKKEEQDGDPTRASPSFMDPSSMLLGASATLQSILDFASIGQPTQAQVDRTGEEGETNPIAVETVPTQYEKNSEASNTSDGGNNDEKRSIIVDEELQEPASNDKEDPPSNGLRRKNGTSTTTNRSDNDWSPTEDVDSPEEQVPPPSTIKDPASERQQQEQQELSDVKLKQDDSSSQQKQPTTTDFPWPSPDQTTAWLFSSSQPTPTARRPDMVVRNTSEPKSVGSAGSNSSAWDFSTFLAGANSPATVPIEDGRDEETAKEENTAWSTMFGTTAREI